ncbi:MAG TPA: hypothetical protein VFU71_23950 [Burkholderiaceae bacterium]|nr:hypothetical protein [Burkholderiaceae bacterium]
MATAGSNQKKSLMNNRRLAALSVAFACCATLSACGGGGGGDAEAAPSGSGTPTPAPAPAPTPSPGAGADWAGRISGSSVVWYHNFDAAAEVNQFRWSGGYQGGNDPQGKGSDGSKVAWVSSGGADGGGFMRLTYPSGVAAGGSYWWRPFAPLNAASTGRGAADPGASGTIPTQAFTVSDGSNTVNSWGATASNPGWYGSPTDQAANPSKYQGNDFYLQVRVRRNGTPGAPPNSAQYSNITGKFVWLTTTNSSYSSQELVTYGQSVSNSDVVGVQSRHNVYNGQNFNSLSGGQPNATVSIANTSLNWRYSGGWDCLLYHVTPGTPGGAGADRTRVEVWAQHDLTQFPSEAGQYAKIWDVTYSQSYDGGTNSVGSLGLPGWNALILAIYHNGSVFTTSTFSFDYDQVIFSKASIPAPTN